MNETPELLRRFAALRDTLLGYRPRITPVTNDLRAEVDSAPELRKQLRDAGCHGHDVALQLYVMLASQLDDSARDILACAAAELAALDRRLAPSSLDAGAAPA